MAWEVVFPIGAVLLFLVIAWAVWRNSKRSAREKAVTEVATKKMQTRPERYEHGERQALEAEAEKARDEPKS